MAKSNRKFADITDEESPPGAPAFPISRQGPLAHQNTFFWLLSRDRFYPKLMRNFALCIVIGSIITGLSLSRSAGMLAGIFIYGLAALHWVWKLLVASHALRRLHNDHRSGALELLLVTPLPIEQILSAQIKHTFHVCCSGAFALCVANAVLFALWRMFSDLPLAPIGGALFLFIDASAITWVAMLQALRPARFPAAVLRVTGVTLLPPLLILMLITYSGRGFSSMDGNTLFFFWFVACGFYDLVLIRRAKNTLNANFRLLAAETAKANPAQSSLPKGLQWLLLRESATARP